MTDTDVQPDAAEDTEDAQPDAADPEDNDDTDIFDAAYVKSLRKESAAYRERAKTAEQRADELAARLHTELVRATGKLADPEALAFDPSHLDDAQSLAGALDALIDAKPYLRNRTPKGDVGQGQLRGTDAAPKSFADLFR